MHAIAKGPALCALGNLFGFLIGLVIDEATARLNGADEDTELFQIVIKGREHVDMVPADAADDGDMRMVMVEFRHAVDR